MTVTLASRTPLDRTRPVLRIRPAPALEPPYDDERPPELWPICPGQLEMVHPPTGRALLRHTAGTSTTSAPGPAGAARSGSSARATGSSAPTTTGSAAPTVTGAATRQPSNEARVAAHRFVSSCLEVLNGFRPPVHLRTLCSAGAYPDIIDQLTRRAVRVRMTPPRTALPGRSPTAGVLMRRQRVCEPRAGVAESAVVLTNSETTWAMAVRLECHRGAWLCTLLQVI